MGAEGCRVRGRHRGQALRGDPFWRRRFLLRQLGGLPCGVAPGRRAAGRALAGAGGPTTYDYGVRVAFSDDEGHSWSEPWTPHEDGTPSEHGFVSVFGLEDGGAGMVWLDGRRFFEADGTRAAQPRMTLRYRTAGADGRWTGGAPVHDDGWVIPGCPVNGPSVAAHEDAVVVAWFTGAGNMPQVRAAFSDDAGATFGAPVAIDLGNPVGRVAVAMPQPGTALVTWLEDDQLFVRSVTAGGHLSPVRQVAASSNARASGFPAMLVDASGRVVFAQTVVDHGVRVLRSQQPWTAWQD